MDAALCPHCQRKIDYQPHLAGRVVNCPGCKGQLQLPLQTTPVAAPPPSPAPSPAPPLPDWMDNSPAPEDLIWKEGTANWVKAATVKGLFPENPAKVAALPDWMDGSPAIDSNSPAAEQPPAQSIPSTAPRPAATRKQPPSDRGVSGGPDMDGDRWIELAVDERLLAKPLETPPLSAGPSPEGELFGDIQGDEAPPPGAEQA